jgi:hypothetical protein
MPAYASTNTTLFQFDPTMGPSTLASIGNFDCIGGVGQDTSMTDLALTAAGELWGVSAHAVYLLQPPASPGAVHCAAAYMLNTATTGTLYGLTFAPKGVLDPNNEVLVGANTAGQLFSIVPIGAALQVTQHGTFGTVPATDGHGHSYMYAGTSWELSGDLVFVAVGGTPRGFATVRDCPAPPSSAGCNTVDTLVEVDLSALAAATTQTVTKAVIGQIVKSSTCTDPANAAYGSTYGITVAGTSVLGFSHQGYAVTIATADGSSCIAASTPGDQWGGAAITTLLP